MDKVIIIEKGDTFYLNNLLQEGWKVINTIALDCKGIRAYPDILFVLRKEED